MKEEGITQVRIAEAIGVHASSVGRELRRNCPGLRYEVEVAQRLYLQRKRVSAKAKKLTPEKVSFLIEQMAKGWTPLQVALSWEKEGPSARYLYHLIEVDRKAGGLLYKQLPFGVRRSRPCKWQRKSSIPNRLDISTRPVGANDRSELGHWEADLVEGSRRRSYLLTMRERKSRLLQVAYLPSKQTVQVVRAIIQLLDGFKVNFKTLTVDNGGEFAAHAQISTAMGKDKSVYFARAYRASDKGSLEQANGLIRRIYPKGTDFRAISAYALQQTAEAINQRPMYVLHGQCPNDFLSALQNPPQN